ncbi:MAG: GYF domain-containing protein [Muribaculaceae bacterium]|nr:GYF domain-containing protein [Muribaculaceae bacterium]
MKIWIYVDGRQQGPFTLEQLLDQPVDENTKVWYEGLPKWYPAGYLDELKPLFDGSLARRIAQEQSESPACEVECEEEPAVTEEHSETVFEDLDESTSGVSGGMCSPSGYTMQSSDDVSGVSSEQCPPTYIGWSLFLAFCCCSPVSVAALAASVCVSVFHNRRQPDRARKASEIAVWLVMISFALGMIPVVLMSAFFGE